jgi:hypothetical protein
LSSVPLTSAHEEGWGEGDGEWDAWETVENGLGGSNASTTRAVEMAHLSSSNSSFLKADEAVIAASSYARSSADPFSASSYSFSTPSASMPLNSTSFTPDISRELPIASAGLSLSDDGVMKMGSSSYGSSSTGPVDSFTSSSSSIAKPKKKDDLFEAMGINANISNYKKPTTISLGPAAASSSSLQSSRLLNLEDEDTGGAGWEDDLDI